MVRRCGWLVVVALHAACGGKSSGTGETESAETEAGGSETGEDMRVFDEVGTWSLQRYALDGTNWQPIDPQARKDAFLLRFDATPGSGTVAAATCGAGGSFSVNGSTCRIALETDRTWQCRCFAYLHEQPNLMQWQEFAPGDAPPDVGAQSISIAVQQDPEINGAALFQPLPAMTSVWSMGGLFDSDGTTSRHQLLLRADNLFEESGCAEACGI